MGKNKLSKFAEMDTIDLVFQYPFSRLKTEGFDSFPMKGRWHEFFGNDRPIVLELGCGKGEYTVGLAQLYPDRNFIGIDIKGARMHSGAVKARDLGMPNVAFLRTQIELIEHFFAPGEVSELWITFPDPQMKKATKRLTGTRFLDLYRKVMADGGIVRLKTDSPFLYTYTRAMAALNGLRCDVDTDDLYHSDLVDPILSIRTHYESQWLARGLTIKYLAFALPHSGDLVEPDDDFERDTYRSYSRGTIDTGILNNPKQ
ncbi:MAG: tRNA (guanosine(46)-N7)-methyltransferase TrmB [Muribaculaceae bacterium]|nr:tRNA (guanosine(46)-N7)-methyltransferase TrmB [Muribaculaceae bacterium]